MCTRWYTFFRVSIRLGQPEHPLVCFFEKCVFKQALFFVISDNERVVSIVLFAHACVRYTVGLRWVYVLCGLDQYT